MGRLKLRRKLTPPTEPPVGATNPYTTVTAFTKLSETVATASQRLGDISATLRGMNFNAIQYSRDAPDVPIPLPPRRQPPERTEADVRDIGRYMLQLTDKLHMARWMSDNADIQFDHDYRDLRTRCAVAAKYVRQGTEIWVNGVASSSGNMYTMQGRIEPSDMELYMATDRSGSRIVLQAGIMVIVDLGRAL